MTSVSCFDVFFLCHTLLVTRVNPIEIPKQSKLLLHNEESEKHTRPQIRFRAYTIIMGLPPPVGIWPNNHNLLSDVHTLLRSGIDNCVAPKPDRTHRRWARVRTRA